MNSPKLSPIRAPKPWGSWQHRYRSKREFEAHVGGPGYWRRWRALVRTKPYRDAIRRFLAAAKRQK